MPDRTACRPGSMLVLAALIVFGAGVSPAAERQPKVHVGGKIFAVTVVDTPETRTRGLSGSDPLAESEGMLFVFDRDGVHPIWMKDMRFSLDVVWISRFGAIVHLERNLHPSTYPRAFASSKPARYVLEIPAGAGKTATLGDPVHFENVPLRTGRGR